MLAYKKIMSGQFLFDFKNDRAGLLDTTRHMPHNMHYIAPRVPSPTMDTYNPYAYGRQLQQHLSRQQSALTSVISEVLDLSRRCDAAEKPPKTPSPCRTNSSFGTISPQGSPTSSAHHLVPLMPANICHNLYSAEPAIHHAPHKGIAPHPGLPTLYPNLCYPSNMKQEPLTTSPTPMEPVSHPPTLPVVPQFPVTASNLLQNYTSASTAPTSPPNSEPHSPARNSPLYDMTQRINAATTPTSNIIGLPSLTNMDSKTTRPFKAFPRDPLVIAANFAAADVLLDNPRVERYTEYRKRVLEQIRNSNGGSRTITNPKMRRTISRNANTTHDGSSNNNSDNEERITADDSSDCDSNAGHFEKMTSSTSSNGDNNNNNNNNNSSNTNANYSSQHKDAAYYERRRKNNAAAKKSRDRRRIKEDEIAIRAAYLERQNIELLCQIDALKSQLATYTSKGV